jgi:hypothetical protein
MPVTKMGTPQLVVEERGFLMYHVVGMGCPDEEAKAGSWLIIEHHLALNPLESIGVCSVIPFPNAKCRVDPTAEGDRKCIPGGGERTPKIKPSVPIPSGQDFAREFEQR